MWRQYNFETLLFAQPRTCLRSICSLTFVNLFSSPTPISIGSYHSRVSRLEHSILYTTPFQFHFQFISHSLRYYIFFHCHLFFFLRARYDLRGYLKPFANIFRNILSIFDSIIIIMIYHYDIESPFVVTLLWIISSICMGNEGWSRLRFFFPLSTVFFIEIDFVFATDNQPIDKEKEEHYFWNPLCLAIAISYANPWASGIYK